MANDFIELVKPGAIDAWQKYNIRSSITIAQAILESNWGENAPGYNLFGIKWFPGCGYDVQYLYTQEYIDGQWQTVQQPFKKYNSYDESIADHTQLLLTDNYAAVRTATDYKQAAQALQDAGYATAPNYAESLINIIEQYGLNYYDGPGFKMYKDYNLISSWAEDDVVWANANGVLVGDGNGYFDPQSNMTREMAAVMVRRLFKLITGS